MEPPIKLHFVIFTLDTFLNMTVDKRDPPNPITEISEKNIPTSASDPTTFSTTKGKMVQNAAFANPVVRANHANSFPKS